MNATSIAVVAGALVIWAAASGRLSRLDVTGPMALLALGVLADALGLVHIAPDDAPLGLVAQAALSLLLFADAARVDVSRLRHDPGPPLRLLGVGLPLTVAAGAVLSHLLWPGWGWGLALALGACLAPTDAGLGSVVVEDPTVPRRIRRTLNVESGLNDGIASPVVTLAIAIAAEEAVGAGPLVADAVRQLVGGLAVGLVVGLAGGWLFRRAREADWLSPSAVPVGGLALAVLAASGATAAGGNGFIAAFVAGLAFGPSVRRVQGAEPGAPSPLELSELGGQLLGSVVWFLVGAALFGPVLRGVGWQGVVYAALSLTAVRMLPVALSLVGSGLDGRTVAFLGWFGPRGLASLVFALEVLDRLGPSGQPVFDVVALTVLVSVVAHGASARPIARRYAASAERLDRDHPTHAEVPPLPARGWPADRPRTETA